MRDIGLPERWAPLLKSVLRIVTGLLFLEHGTRKLPGFPASPVLSQSAAGACPWSPDSRLVGPRR